MEAEKNKGGRPRKENPFNHTQGFQVSEEEKAVLMYMSIRLNCSMSEVVRKVFNLAIVYTNVSEEDKSEWQFTDAYGENQFKNLKKAWKIIL